jgi:predicted PurR-regulated permease PerM
VTRAAIWGIIIIATTCVFGGLYFFRPVLTQMALALMLWLAIESVAIHIRRVLPKRFSGFSSALAFIAIVLVFGLVGYEVTRNVGTVAAQAGVYEERLNTIIAQAYEAMHIASDPPTIHALVASINMSSVMLALAGGFRSVASNTIFILIYLAFLYPAAERIHFKLDHMYPNPEERAHVRDVLTTIRRLMAQYLWVQTILASIVGVLTYLTLLALGVHNSMFWGVLAFFLNFIPTIGPIVAVVLPVMFSIVQFQTLGPVAGVFAGLLFMQLVVANVVQPRMMSDSLNLSALVVLLSLAVWGFLWGLTGALLSAPLTVMVMIIMAQFSNTRWIAILLSADGDPGGPRRKRSSEHVKAAA